MHIASPEKQKACKEQGWWGELTLYDMFAANAAENPKREAIVDPPNRDKLTFGEPRRLNYADMSLEVDRLAGVLLANGIGKGDILLVQMPNITELVTLYFACASIGVMISPVPVQYREFELEAIAKKIKPKAFVCCTIVKGGDHIAVAKQVIGSDCQIMTFGPDADESMVDLTKAQAAGGSDLKDYRDANPISADDVFTICWTSGTTGVPKGVPRSHNHWVAIASATYAAANLRDGDILLNPFPLINMASIGGVTMSWLHVAGTMVLHHPFDVAVYLGQIATEKPAFTVAPPAILNMLLQSEEMLARTDLSSLRVIGSGSAPLAPAMVQGFQERFNITINNLFGSNEGVSLVSSGNDVPDPELRASYFPCASLFDPRYGGKKSSFLKTRLVDHETGVEVSEDDVSGELQIAGPSVFEGYFKSPEETKEAFTDDGYFRTGDLFQTVENGKFFKFVGRCKDLIIRGGVNIAPDELDQLLGGHPDLMEACTIGIPDAVLGERVAVAVVGKPDTAIELESITEYLKEKGVAIFKFPEKVVHFDTLPRNPLNKIDKQELRIRTLAELN